MPIVTSDDTSIYFEETGEGRPLLLLGPGGIRANIGRWKDYVFDPLVEFEADFHLIAFDERNSGRSSGPLVLDDPWSSYCDDACSLLDHLRIGSLSVLGACVGASHALRLIERLGPRVQSAVIIQPIGVAAETEASWHSHRRSQTLDRWACTLMDDVPGLDRGLAFEYCEKMLSSDFVFSIPRETATRFELPMLVFPGIDEIHSTEIAREVAGVAQNAEFVPDWRRSPDAVSASISRIRNFILESAA